MEEKLTGKYNNETMATELTRECSIWPQIGTFYLTVPEAFSLRSILHSLRSANKIGGTLHTTKLPRCKVGLAPKKKEKPERGGYARFCLTGAFV